MAGIDKIYLNKEDVPTFYEFLRSIDDDFRRVFVNCESILDYTYYDTQSTPEELAEWSGDQVPVSNFPSLVDKFLYQHPRTPQHIKEYLLGQYGGHEEELTATLYPEDPRPYSGRFRIVQKRPSEGKMFDKPASYWNIYPLGGMCWIVPLKKYVPYEYIKPEHAGLLKYFGHAEIKFKSMKAVYRFIRKHKFPVGTRIIVNDARYVISSLTLEIVPER